MQEHLCNIDFYQQYKKWRQGCGVFECFVHSTSFVTLKNYPDFLITRPDCQLGETTAKYFQDISQKYLIPMGESETKTVSSNGKNSLLMIDLLPETGLRAAYFFQSKLYLKPILTYRQINHPNGLVFHPDEIALFMAVSEKMTEDSQNGYMFLLDSSRYSDFSEEMYRKNFNNQYELSEYDLPVFEMLRDLQYQRVVYIYQKAVKEDMISYLEYLKENGIEVVISELNYNIEEKI